MIEHMRHLVESVSGDPLRSCAAREYLQARVLESLQDAGVFNTWAFVGGTALRFLYSIPRFSEDLDFSLARPGAEARFREALAEVRRVLVREDYPLEIKLNDRRAVASAWLRFPGLPYRLGLSPQQGQVLTIKVELDTNPPAGAGLETSIVRRHVILHVCHHDKPSLLAGKIHAVMSRSWSKGRDLFDLGWYLADGRWPEPNLELLNVALAQTGWDGEPVTSTNWKDLLLQRLAAVDWAAARGDVRPFLERERDIDLVSMDALEKLLAP